jgi:IS30 family transposase
VAGSAPLQTVATDLKAGWSPEQIARRLSHIPTDEPKLLVSHATIYRYIYAQPRGELRKTLIAVLRQAHKSRLPRTRRQDRRGRLRDLVSIHKRSAEEQGREVVGHWEGDIIKVAVTRAMPARWDPG